MDKEIRILPYTKVDGIPTLRDSDLYGLYARMAEEGKVESVFYDGGVRGPEDFLDLFKNRENWLYVYMAAGEKPLGFFWVNCFEGESCRVHFCMFREAGRHVLKMGRMCLEFLGKHFRLVRGVTPTHNTLACKFIQKCGMVPVGTVPDRVYDYYQGKTGPALISYYQSGVKED